MTKKTILMLGAQGVLGRFTASALQAAGHKVYRAGRRTEDSADFRCVDLDRMETLTAALQGIDLVVSTIEDPQVRAELAILRQGGVLLSAATIPAGARRLLDAEAAKGAIGTVVTNSGFSGVGALVVKDLLEQFPKADEVEMAYVVSTSGSSGLTGARYGYRLLTEVAGMRTARLTFSPPRGARWCFDLSDNDEVWMSPKMLGKRKLRPHLTIAEKGLNGFLMLLNRLRILQHLPEAALTTAPKLKPAPSALSREPMRARLAVYQGKQLLAARGLESEGDYHSTVQATTVFAGHLLALRDQGVISPGICGVEDLFHMKDLQTELNADRIYVRPLTE